MKKYVKLFKDKEPLIVVLLRDSHNESDDIMEVDPKTKHNNVKQERLGNDGKISATVRNKYKKQNP